MKHEFYLAGDTVCTVGGTKKWSKTKLENLKIQIALHNKVSPDLVTYHSFKHEKPVDIGDDLVNALLDDIKGVTIKRKSKL